MGGLALATCLWLPIAFAAFPVLGSVSAGAKQDLSHLVRRLEEIGRDLVVEFSDGRLTLLYSSGRRVSMVAVAEGLFRHLWEPTATIAFVEDEGKGYLQGDFGSYVQAKPPADVEAE